MDANVVDVIYSKDYDEVESILKIRKHLNTIYTIEDIFNIKEEYIDKVLNSKITKEILYKVLLNIIASIKDDTYYGLFTLDDYNYIVDNNIDDALKNINLPKIINVKEILSSVLKKIGKKIFDDVKSTQGILDTMPRSKYYFYHFLLGENTKSILISIDIILILLLVLLEYSNKILLHLVNVSIGIIGVLLITNIYMLISQFKYKNEWEFMKSIYNGYNLSLIKYELMYILVGLVMYFSYKYLKKTISNK